MDLLKSLKEGEMEKQRGYKGKILKFTPRSEPFCSPPFFLTNQNMPSNKSKKIKINYISVWVYKRRLGFRFYN